MKYYLIAMGAWNLVRAFIHSFNHGYDLVFELRMIQCIVPLCFAALVVVIAEALKVLRTNSIRSYEPINFTAGKIFQSLDLAPAPEKVPGSFVYIEDDNRVYSSDGVVWKPV